MEMLEICDEKVGAPVGMYKIFAEDWDGFYYFLKSEIENFKEVLYISILTLYNLVKNDMVKIHA